MLNPFRKLTKELVRRGVLRALAAYIAIVWLLAQGLVDLFPAVGLPDWAIQVFLSAAVVGTPLVLIVAWRYDLTTRGFLRDRADVALERRRSAFTQTVEPTRNSQRRKDGGNSTLVANWTDDDGKDRKREFYNEFVVGRDYNADVRLNEECVSRRHLRVYPVGNDWFVEDLDSLNGSYIDGKRVAVDQLGPQTELRLDRNGPRLRMAIMLADETVLTADST